MSTKKKMAHTARRTRYLWKGGVAPSVHALILIQLRRSKTLLAKVRSFQFPDPAIAEELQAAVTAQERCARLLEAIPADWKPPKGALTYGAVLDRGAQVRIRREKAASYKDYGLAEDAVLTVHKVVGGKAFCLADVDGVQMVVPVFRSHVVEVNP